MTPFFSRVYIRFILFGSLLLSSHNVTALEKIPAEIAEAESGQSYLFALHQSTDRENFKTLLEDSRATQQRKKHSSKANAAHRNGNYEKAFRIWSALAADGDAPSQFAIAIYFHRGHGRAPDIVEALTWYYRSAVGGYARAMFNLGIAYWEGWGVGKDHKLAVSWWRMGADKGGTASQYNLGIAYLSGDGVNQNTVKAVYWLTKAARGGSEKALAVLQSLFKRYRNEKQPRVLNT
jgi:TPR repeat protein